MSCILVSRSIGGIFVDVVISEEHKATMEIATHPVESGAKISDHAWRMPYSVTLESVIGSDRAVSSYQALLALQEKAEPFSLITGLKIYGNMLIKDLTAERNKEHSRVLKFTAEMEEVIIVSTETSSGKGDSDDDKAKDTTKRGSVTSRTSESIPSKTNSILDNAKAVD